MSTHIKLSTSPIKRPETVNALLINHYKFVFDFNVNTFFACLIYFKSIYAKHF